MQLCITQRLNETEIYSTVHHHSSLVHHGEHRVLARAVCQHCTYSCAFGVLDDDWGICIQLQRQLCPPPPCIVQILTTHLDYDHDHLHTTLISLGQIAKLQPAMFEPKHKFIVRDFIVKKLLVTDRVGYCCITYLQRG